MIGTTVSHYRIIEKLGEGGMGIVYKAEDLKLTRTVALKFLPHGLDANEPERARFLQEARAAAILNHPNICTVYDIQEHDGQQFIVMEYVEGKTLHDIKPVKKTQDAIGYAIQIAEALQEAHAHGIIHRDIKAENIMVNAKNQVKVMDFGLAKLRGSLKLTKATSTVGTLAYMAPEQIQGGEVDARSDIFSFGVVLFEMLTGHSPFRGEHEAAMMYSILNEGPQSLQQYGTDAPPDLDRIIHRALEKDPEDRYQHIDDMVSELRRLRKQSTRILHPSPVERPGESTGGIHRVSEANADGNPPSRRWKTRTILLAGAGILIIGLGVVFMVLNQKPNETIRSMAVLPFTNTSGDADIEYLSDGFTESLINTLSKLPGIKMMSSRSVFRFKGTDIDPQKAAQELHVDAVLTGRILQRGDNLSISTELINAKDNSHIWGAQYNRKSSDLIVVETAISREISEQLNVAMSGDQQKRFAAAPTQNVEAYQLFLKGRFSLNKRTKEGFDKAIGYFRQAIDRDPSFARAYAGLAETFALQGSYYLLPVRSAIDSVRSAAGKALELDGSIGEAHAALGSSAEGAWDWPRAEKEYRLCIELSPNFVTGRQWYGEYLSAMGRFEEGLKEIQKAQELDPLSPIVYMAQGGTLVYHHRYDEAIQQANKALELDPHLPRALSLLGLLYLLKGSQADAIREFERAVVESDSSLEYVASLGYAYGTVGRRTDAEKILARIRQQSNHQFVSPSLYAVIFTGMGDKENAFLWLNRALETHDPAMEYMKVDPTFDPLRGDQRFAELVKKVGLPQ